MMRRLVVDAERAGAQAVLSDRRERQAEGRLREAARDRKQDEEDGEAVERRVALSGKVDREQAEQRRDREVEAVGAAGDPARAVGEFSKHERDAERHHEPRQVGAAQQERRGDETDDRGDDGAEGEPERRIGETLARQNRRRIGAKAEKRRMPERDDAGQAENEIERQGEQAGDENLVDDRRARRHGEDRGQDRKPEDDFGPAPARAPIEVRREAARRRRRIGRAHRPSPRANSPCGRTISVTTITA